MKIFDGMGSKNTCPVCGSHEIKYESLEANDNSVSYPVTCSKCNTTFDECYDLVFSGHYNIYPDKNNNICVLRKKRSHKPCQK